MSHRYVQFCVIDAPNRKSPRLWIVFAHFHLPLWLWWLMCFLWALTPLLSPPPFIRRWCRWSGSSGVGWLTSHTSCFSKTATTTCACPSTTCPRRTGGASCSPATRCVGLQGHRKSLKIRVGARSCNTSAWLNLSNMWSSSYRAF